MVKFCPLFGASIRIWNDGASGAFGFANAAIDALVGIDDEHILAFIEAIDGANLDAIHIFAKDAGIGNDVGHVRISG